MRRLSPGSFRAAIVLGAMLVAVASGQAAIGGTAATTGTPTITSVSPNTAALQGTVQVKVVGNGFLCGGKQPDSRTAVLFGSTPVVYGSTGASSGPNIQLVSNTQVLVSAPAAPTPGPVDIRVVSPCGTSPTNPADVFTYLGECTSSCAVQVTAQTDGPAAGRAAGVLNGVAGGWSDTATMTKEAGYMNDLALARWRTGGGDTAATFYQLFTKKPAIGFILSGGWWTVMRNSSYLAPGPWFDGFVTWNKYLKAMASGQQFCGPTGLCTPPPPGPVSFWEVWNEPGTYVDLQRQGTSSQFYALFADTYHTLAAILPNPQIIIPTMEAMIDWPLPSSGPLNADNYISMKNLFDWIDTYNHTPGNAPLRFAGYSFHVINSGATCAESPYTPRPGCAAYPLNTPNAVGDAVTRVRNLLDQYPDLGPAQIEVSEFGTGQSFSNGNVQQPQAGSGMIPGWQAGFLASFERANVSSVTMGCWPVYYGLFNLTKYDTCGKGFDGLLADDNQGPSPNTMDQAVGPQAIYWVYKFYGSMTGTRVVTTSSASDMTAFATRDDSTSTMKVLLGRAQRCSIDGGRDPGCPANGNPANVSMQICWPYGGATVKYSLQHIANQGLGLGGLYNPADPTSGRVAVSGGMVTIPISAVPDGDAYTLVLTPQ